MVVGSLYSIVQENDVPRDNDVIARAQDDCEAPPGTKCEEIASVVAYLRHFFATTLGTKTLPRLHPGKVNIGVWNWVEKRFWF
jgi:hypothetical protein